MGFCVGVYLCVIRTPSSSSKQPIFYVSLSVSVLKQFEHTINHMLNTDTTFLPCLVILTHFSQVIILPLIITVMYTFIGFNWILNQFHGPEPNSLVKLKFVTTGATTSRNQL